MGRNIQGRKLRQRQWLSLSTNPVVDGVFNLIYRLFASNGLFRFGSGLSIVVFTVMTGTLVRAIGYAFRNQSIETLQNAAGIFWIPIRTGVFVLVSIVGPSGVGHFEHFLEVLSGAAIELSYVFEEHRSEAVETDTDVRDSFPPGRHNSSVSAAEPSGRSRSAENSHERPYESPKPSVADCSVSNL